MGETEMGSSADRSEDVAEVDLLRQEIEETPDRGVLDGDPEALIQYFELLQNLHVAATATNKEGLEEYLAEIKAILIGEINSAPNIVGLFNVFDDLPNILERAKQLRARDMALSA